MVLFDSSFYRVSQGFFSGWKVESKLTGTIAVPSSLMKERVGFVWMQVRKTKKSKSVDSKMSEEVMFGSFAKAVLDPSCSDGRLWLEKSPDELSDMFIDAGNDYMRNASRLFPLGNA